MDDAPTTLQRPLQVDRIVTVHDFEYSSNYAFVGEQHDFWEFVYVDKGEIEVCADQRELVLKKGELLFHKPGEFHSLRANGGGPNLVIASFFCDSPAMEFFNQRLVTVGDKEWYCWAGWWRKPTTLFPPPWTTLLLSSWDAAPRPPLPPSRWWASIWNACSSSCCAGGTVPRPSSPPA